MPDNQGQGLNNMNNKFSKFTKKVHGAEQGMNGVENVLITAAFAALISIFFFVVLNGGSTASVRVNTIQAKIPQVIPNLEITSPIMVNSSEAGIKNIIFSIKITGNSSPSETGANSNTSDANDRMVINLTTDTDQVKDIRWTSVAADSNNLLENGDEFEIVIDLSNLGDGRHFSEPLVANSQFNVQVKPDKGTISVSIQRALTKNG
jgi:hypothetical protein